jgi:hypothetical protein
LEEKEMGFDTNMGPDLDMEFGGPAPLVDSKRFNDKDGVAEGIYAALKAGREGECFLATLLTFRAPSEKKVVNERGNKVSAPPELYRAVVPHEGSLSRRLSEKYGDLAFEGQVHELPYWIFIGSRKFRMEDNCLPKPLAQRDYDCMNFKDKMQAGFIGHVMRDSSPKDKLLAQVNRALNGSSEDLGKAIRNLTFLKDNLQERVNVVKDYVRLRAVFRGGKWVWSTEYGDCCRPAHLVKSGLSEDDRVREEARFREAASKGRILACQAAPEGCVPSAYDVEVVPQSKFVSVQDEAVARAEAYSSAFPNVADMEKWRLSEWEADRVKASAASAEEARRQDLIKRIMELDRIAEEKKDMKARLEALR